jgi:Tfp pilus assembly protein PilF
MTALETSPISSQMSRNPEVSAFLEKSHLALQKKDFLEAEKSLLNASKIEPENDQIWSNLGVAAKRRKDYKAAVKYYNKGLKINPQNAGLLSNIGSLLLQIKDFAQAVKFLQQALAIDDKSANAWNNLGSCHFHLGRYNEAQYCYEKSLLFDVNNYSTRFNLSWCLLRIGEFQRGFQLYEARFNKEENTAIVKNIHSPRWQRQSLIDNPKAKLCITAEQGFGDTLQFIRFIPQLLGTNLVTQEQLIIHVQPQCEKLISQSYPEITVINNQQPEPPESLFHIPLMSLPLLCHLNPLNIPNAPYLKSDKTLLKAWQENINLQAKTKTIGVTWKGSPTNFDASYRSIDFQNFIQIFTNLKKPVNLISLSIQPDVQKQIDEFNQNKPDIYSNLTFQALSKPIENFSDTAAIIQNTDLIITIDTAVAHLSGALGKKTFSLIPYTSDWRWFKNITHSPWYPSMQLFRQKKYRDWELPIRELNEVLNNWLNSK